MKEKLKRPIMKSALIVIIPIKFPWLQKVLQLCQLKMYSTPLSFSLDLFLVIKTNIHLGKQSIR